MERRTWDVRKDYPKDLTLAIIRKKKKSIVAVKIEMKFSFS